MLVCMVVIIVRSVTGQQTESSGSRASFRFVYKTEEKDGRIAKH